MDLILIIFPFLLPLMPFLGFFTSGIGKYIAIGALVLAVVGGGIWYVNDRAYNRGEKAGIEVVTKQMIAALERQRQATVQDWDRLKTMDRLALERELWKKCMADPRGGEAICGKQP